jgi:hypothetical protein
MMKLQTLAALAAGILAATLGGFEGTLSRPRPVEARNWMIVVI